MNKPHLVITARTPQGLAFTGECSSCGREKAYFEAGGELWGDAGRLQDIFDEHVMQVHLDEFARVAGEIVTEPTERD